MSGDRPERPESKLSERAVEHARAFISSLFMALRTAQIHDITNKAFEKAVNAVYDSASKLFAATDGFQIQFVEQTVFLNGGRIRFEQTLFQTVRTLEEVLRSKEIGGLNMRSPPSFDGVRALVVELSKDDPEVEALAELNIGMLGPQIVSDGPAELKVDRKLLAVQSYAKLMLALREHLRRIRAERREGRSSPLRLRIVRVVQDLVELAADRPDFLLRMSANSVGAEPEVLHGVNASLLVLVMGHALRFERRNLVDLAMGTLFHHVGAEEGQALDEAAQDASLARVLNDVGVTPAALTRAIIVAHHRKRADGRCNYRRYPPHVYARIAGVAITYSQLVGGFGMPDGHRADPLDALRVLMEDETGRFDPDILDVLINVLRAFPVGCHVMLDDGNHAIVTSHGGSSRWDRPIVATQGEGGKNVDLMLRNGDRFSRRIVATARHLGVEQEITIAVRKNGGLRGTIPPMPSFAVDITGPEPPRTPPPRLQPSAIVGSESEEPEPPKEDLDDLFKEFLSDGEEPKPRRVDTSYSSTKGE